MEIILLLILGGVLFVVFGIIGWGLKGLGLIFDFLMEGCSTTLGCLFWAILILFLLAALL